VRLSSRQDNRMNRMKGRRRNTEYRIQKTGGRRLKAASVSHQCQLCSTATNLNWFVRTTSVARASRPCTKNSRRQDAGGTQGRDGLATIPSTLPLVLRFRVHLCLRYSC